MPSLGKWVRTAYAKNKILDHLSLSRMLPNSKIYDTFDNIKKSDESISYLENGNIIKINNCKLYDKTYLLHDSNKYNLKRIHTKRNCVKHNLNKEETNKYKKVDKLLIINFYPNFAHIILDTLPCLINFFNKQYEIDMKIHIINDDVGLRIMIKQILSGFIDINNFINTDENLNINEAYIICPLHKCSHQYIRFNKNYLKLLNKSNDILKNNLLKSNINIETFNKIYISRRYRKESENKGIENIHKENGHSNFWRSITNHKEFAEHISQKWEFKEIFLEDYNILEKIYIINNADYILADGGAGCAIWNFVEKKNILVLLCPFYAFWNFPHEITVKKNKNKLNYMAGTLDRNKLFKNINSENRTYEYNKDSVDNYFKTKWII